MHSLLKCAGECGNRRKTRFRPFGERTQEHRVDLFRDARIDGARWPWRGIEVLVHHLAEATLERCASRQQFVGHVGWRAAHGLADAGGRAIELGDAKIGEQQIGTARVLFIALNEEVAGLDILVDDLVVMGMLQCPGGLCENLGNLLG